MICIEFLEGERYKEIIGKLTQWDYGQVIQIGGIPLRGNIEMHFAQAGSDQALRCEAYCENDILSAEIPDKYLEEAKSIYAYVYVTSERRGSTEYTICMNVKARARPEDWTPADRSRPG